MNGPGSAFIGGQEFLCPTSWPYRTARVSERTAAEIISRTRQATVFEARAPLLNCAAELVERIDHRFLPGAGRNGAFDGLARQDFEVAG